MSDATSVSPEITEVFRRVLQQPDLELNRTTTADDVSGWDSLSHIQIVVALEKAFGIRFSSSEITDLPDVGALCDLIEAKQSG